MFQSANETPSFWRLVVARALRQTLRAWDLKMSGIAIGAVVSVIGVLLQVLFDGLPRTSAQVVEAGKVALAGPAVFVVIFITNVYRSANELYDSQAERITTLESALETRARATDIGQKLMELRRHGYWLFGQKVAAGGVDAWTTDVEKWQADVLSLITGHVTVGELSEFQVVGILPPPDLRMARAPHAKRLRKLRRQLEVLTQIMGKF